MKKSIIKRRKRVVPATHEQESANVHLAAFRVSPSPNSHYSENIDLRRHGQDSPSADLNGSLNHDARSHMDHQHHHQYEPPPIGVDFTGYQIDQQHQNHLSLPGIRDTPVQHPSSPDSQRTLSPFMPTTSRKRSFSDAQLEKPTSESGRTNRLSSISSILNPTRRIATDEMPIDPSLSGIGQPPTRQQSQLPQIQQQQQQQQQQQPALPPENRMRNVVEGDPGGWDRWERKARLRREVDQIREIIKAKERELKAKERELEELGGEGWCCDDFWLFLPGHLVMRMVMNWNKEWYQEGHEMLHTPYEVRWPLSCTTLVFFFGLFFLVSRRSYSPETERFRNGNHSIIK